MKLKLLLKSIFIIFIVNSILNCQTGSWTIEAINDSGYGGQFLSLSNYNDLSVIAFYDNVEQKIVVKTRNVNGNWQNLFSSSILQSPNWVSIEVKNNNEYNLVYTKNSEVFYTGWLSEPPEANISIIDNSNQSGQFLSMEIDNTNKLGLTYQSAGTNSIKYAKQIGGTVWDIQTIYNSSTSPSWSSLIYDDMNRPNVVTGDLATGEIKYLGWLPLPPLASFEIVDDVGNVGEGISLAVDENNKPIISYYDVTNQDLKFAFRPEDTWFNQTVDAEGNVGNISSIINLMDGKFGIAYNDVTNGSIKYAENFAAVDKTPLILIPGIMGSALYNDQENQNHLEDNERIWIKLPVDLSVLKLAEDGFTPHNSLDNIRVAPIRGDTIRTIKDELNNGNTGFANLPLSFFDDMVCFLDTIQGYKLDVDSLETFNKDLFIFTYDWRKSIGYNSQELQKYIQNILYWTGKDNVNLICHSMGGLVAKKMIKDIGTNSNKIKKLIFIGTPHLGAPKAYYTSLKGDLQFPINFYSTKQILDISRNFASGYTLFPTEFYFDNNLSNNTTQHPEIYDDIIQENYEDPFNYNQTGEFFKTVQVHPDINNYYNYNDNLIDSAYTLHQNLENIDFGNIEVYNIVGIDQPTLNKVYFLENQITTITDVFYENNLNGDGTVPLKSAELINGTIETADTTYYITGGDASHTDLLKNEAVFEILSGLLSEPTRTFPFYNANISITYPESYGVSNRQALLFGPTELHAYDSLMNHTGLTNDSTWEANIPGSTYISGTMNDPSSSKLIVFNNKQKITFKILGNGQSGEMDLQFVETDNGFNEIRMAFEDVEILPTTITTCKLDTLNNNVNLEMDYDGDGTKDSTIYPSIFTDVKKDDHPIPMNFRLYQNYPNPFNPNTTIIYQLPINNIVSLKIFDILGKEIATLVNEEKTAGKYEIRYNASNLSSGIYFYRLNAGDFVQTKKMILLK